tara:strand:+ start:1705 stop:1986 length:282 start_codon:yes stop_codon:yes gene_type:complete
MALSKKHFEALAETIADTAVDAQLSVEQVDILCSNVVKTLSYFNPRFNEERFVDYVIAKLGFDPNKPVTADNQHYLKMYQQPMLPFMEGAQDV